jgi:pyruvate/2-oxoglutarate dehydrogenase complex dihydrolipoamide acyltransferase (E2) component
VYAPRVNNNDDVVRVVRLPVATGAHVRRGDIVAEIETDKSVATVEAERDGYVLQILCAVDDMVAVGGVLIWLGATTDEIVPATGQNGAAPAVGGSAGPTAAGPTAKARALLTTYGLSAHEVAASSDRLSAADVEAHVARRGDLLAALLPDPGRSDAGERTSISAGDVRRLSVSERGMLRTVSWHRDEAVAAYLEIEFDSTPWEEQAAAFAAQHKLLLSPMLALMAYRLVGLARETTKINATIVDGQLHQYRHVNLGFTVQAGETLHIVVARDAGAMDAAAFVSALGELQRHAIGRKLRPDESQGTTVGFSSMGRWNVSRHIPVLAPYTSLMVAHAAPRPGGAGVLGATYDHRILSGFDVSRVLNQLTRPSGSS